jgi:hypothetical protein
VRREALENLEQDCAQQVDICLRADSACIDVEKFGSSIGQCAGTAATADQDAITAREVFS